MHLKLFFFVSLLFAALHAEDYTMGGKTFTLNPDPTINNKRSENTLFYRDEKGKIVGITKRIIIKFTTLEHKEEIYKEADVSQVQQLSDTLFTVEATSAEKTLLTCKALQAFSEVEFAHPDFIYQKEKRNTEPLYNELWHLENKGQFGGLIGADINATGAWKITKGIDVKIAVIDDGFDTLHEDLKDAIVAQKDFDYGDNDASYSNTHEYHGTLCSGIALARENGKGTVGVAPKSSLIAIKVGGKDENGEILMTSDSQLISSFLWAKEQGADVISCSWGTYNVSDGLKTTIDSIALSGRNGLGTPIFFAAGNDGLGQYAWSNDEAALESVIAVGASTDRNERAYFSNYGVSLDIVAPGGDGYSNGFGIATTDLTGTIGYEYNSQEHPNYTFASDGTGFHGTSASTPMAAATAALMLSINPSLTKDALKSILETTADKIGYTPYINGRNNYLGYGKINAGAATLKAQESATFTQSLTIKSGVWNLMGISSNQSIYDIASTFGTKTWRIYGWDNTKATWKVWASDRTCNEIVSAGLQCLEQINPGEGFFIANYGSAGDSTISLKGGKTSTSFPLVSKGWNLISLGNTVALSLLKQTYGQDIVVWKMSNGQYIRLTSDTDTLAPNDGFWIKVL